MPSASLLSAFSFFDSINAEISMFRYPQSHMPDEQRWSCSATLALPDAELRVKGYGRTADEAILSAHGKLSTNPILSTFHPEPRA